MKNKQTALIVVLALLAGFVGGLLSNQLINIKSAFAEKEPKPQKVIVAEMFKIVNEKGQVCGSFGGHEKGGKPAGILSLYGDNSSVHLAASETAARLHLKTNKTVIEIDTWNGMGVDTDYASIELSRRGSRIGDHDIEIRTDRGTYIKLADYKGNMRTVIGNTETVTPKTGVAHKHPISSIVLFNEKGDVLWSAP
jgi:hypothetical protein